MKVLEMLTPNSTSDQAAIKVLVANSEIIFTINRSTVLE